MNATDLPGAPDWFAALLNLSLQASLLAAIVWVITKSVGRWIPPAWRALLWFVVLVRLVIPIAPPSAASLQNLFVHKTPIQTQSQPKHLSVRAEEISGPLPVFTEPIPATPVVPSAAPIS